VEHSSEKIEAMKLAGTYEAYLHSETLRVIAPYAVLGIVVFLWGLIILLTKFPILTPMISWPRITRAR